MAIIKILHNRYTAEKFSSSFFSKFILLHLYHWCSPRVSLIHWFNAFINFYSWQRPVSFGTTSLPVPLGILLFLFLSPCLVTAADILRTRPVWPLCLIWKSHTTGHFIVWKVIRNRILTVFSNPPTRVWKRMIRKVSCWQVSLSTSKMQLQPVITKSKETDILTKVPSF